MGSTKIKTTKKDEAMSSTQAETQTAVVEGETAAETAEKKVAAKVKKSRVRGKKYQTVRGMVDKTKSYEITDAIELVKQMSFTKFTGSVEMHVQVREVGMSATVKFPHSTGKSIRVALVTDALLNEISNGQINFDVLIAKPEEMKNLTKFARTLGPKGLMPNPKNGTLTPNPEAKKKELESGAVTLKTDRKSPVIHTLIGKTDADTKLLVANAQALLKAFNDKVVRVYVAASMSPSVRVKLS